MTDTEKTKLHLLITAKQFKPWTPSTAGMLSSILEFNITRQVISTPSVCSVAVKVKNDVIPPLGFIWKVIDTSVVKLHRIDAPAKFVEQLNCTSVPTLVLIDDGPWSISAVEKNKYNSGDNSFQSINIYWYILFLNKSSWLYQTKYTWWKQLCPHRGYKIAACTRHAHILILCITGIGILLDILDPTMTVCTH